MGFDYTSSIGIIPSPFQFLYQKRRTYSLPHELRIYLNQGPSWYVFLGMRNRFRAVRAIFLNELEFSPFIPGIEPPENQAGFSSAVYLGLNKAIGDNAYWELKLQSSLLTPNFEINERGFSINNSFKVFLNQAWQWKTDSLENRFLKAGNMFIAGQANLFFSYEESRNRTIFINPTIESFVSDHWTLRTEFSLFYQRIEEEFSFYVASTLTMSVFAQVAPQFYLRPILGFGFSQEISAYYMPISLELNYFSPQARWYHGYTYTRYAGFSFSTFANQNQLRIYGGVDYFILPNVFIRGNIDYEMVNLADLPTGNGLFGPNSLKWFKPEIGIHFML